MLFDRANMKIRKPLNLDFSPHFTATKPEAACICRPNRVTLAAVCFLSGFFHKVQFSSFQTLNMLKHIYEKCLVLKITNFQSDRNNALFCADSY